MPLGDEAARSFEAMLKRPTIRDQFGSPTRSASRRARPPRTKTRPFSQRRLLRQDVRRLPQGRGIAAAEGGGVAALTQGRQGDGDDRQRRRPERLAAVSRELDRCPPR